MGPKFIFEPGPPQQSANTGYGDLWVTIYNYKKIYRDCFISREINNAVTMALAPDESHSDSNTGRKRHVRARKESPLNGLSRNALKLKIYN